MVTDKRTALLESAVRAISKYGMNAVSTRSISRGAGLNDAYIYRIFQDKEDLLAQAFLMEDRKYINFIKNIFDQLNEHMETPLEQSSSYAFHRAWRYLLDTPDVCHVFMYYFHSPSFVTHAQEEHRLLIEDLARSILYLFPSFADARHCLLTMFSVINGLALNMLTGMVPDTEFMERKAFEITYAIMHSSMHPMTPWPEEDAPV